MFAKLVCFKGVFIFPVFFVDDQKLGSKVAVEIK